MKFQQLAAFEKHLEKACPNHLSPVYIVAAACAFERRKICEKICNTIEKKEKKITSFSFEGNKDWVKAREELETASFLSGYRILILEEADKLKKNILTALMPYVTKPSPFISLILSGASLKPLSELYEQGKKELVVCDLSAEKPWERKERLKNHLIKLVASDGKQLTRDAVEMLIERIGLDLSQLEQEVHKLLCYCLDCPKITVKEVNLLCVSEKGFSIWHLAEAIVWQEGILKVDPTFDSASFLYLLGQVRSHLQNGLQLALYLKQGKRPQEISLPFFKPQFLEKIVPLTHAFSYSFFKEALSLTFNMEMLAKSSSLSVLILFDLLVAKMALLKRERHALSST